jgi:hypothetical protein
MRRFFYHYNKHQNKMTIHWKKQCIIVKNIKCNVPCETHWSLKQPRIIIRGFANDVTIEGEIATIK